jgi:hypothetical protein
MGRTPIRAKLVLDVEARSKLESIAKSRTEGQARIERARVLLAYHAGDPVVFRWRYKLEEESVS